MNYGKAIRTIRAARGISQRDLAARCDLDPSYISLIEAGERAPSLTTLDALSKALQAPLYLIALLASEADDVRGVSPKHAQVLGKDLLDVLLESEQRVRR